MRASDSVKFRRNCRAAAEETPYTEIGTSVLNQPDEASTLSPITATSKRNGRRQVRPNVSESDSSSSDSDSDDVYDYVPLLPGDACSSTASLYLQRVGNTFLDIDENIRFRITDVCEGRKNGGRSVLLFYKYVDVDDLDGEEQFTECRELLNSSWAKWDPTTSASNRSARLSARTSNNTKTLASATNITRGRKRN
jgi:hypothetical protein